MKRLNDDGSSTGLVISLTVFIMLFIAATGFAFWAYASRTDYKTNSDKKVAVAVAAAQKTTAAEKDSEYAEKAKSPLKTYTGPEAYGSVKLDYPKTWSGYVVQSATGSNTPVDAYFYPDIVPGPVGTSSASGGPQIVYALRISVLASAYDVLLKAFDSSVSNGKVKVSAFKAAKVAGEVGARIDGEVVPGKQGSMVLLPLRDKTLEVWTESSDFTNDFNTTILPSLTFIP